MVGTRGEKVDCCSPQERLNSALEELPRQIDGILMGGEKGTSNFRLPPSDANLYNNDVALDIRKELEKAGAPEGRPVRSRSVWNGGQHITVAAVSPSEQDGSVGTTYYVGISTWNKGEPGKEGYFDVFTATFSSDGAGKVDMGEQTEEPYSQHYQIKKEPGGEEEEKSTGFFSKNSSPNDESATLLVDVHETLAAYTDANKRAARVTIGVAAANAATI